MEMLLIQFSCFIWFWKRNVLCLNPLIHEKNSLILQNYVGPVVEYYYAGVKSVWPMFETYFYPLVDRMILTVLYAVVSR